MGILRPSVARRSALAATGMAVALTLAACGSTSPGMNHGGTADPSSSASGMHGMSNAGNGLAAEQDGYRLDAQDTTLPAGKAARFRFTIVGPDGKAVTNFAEDKTKRLHFFAIRSDLTGYQHVHPAMDSSGAWTANLGALAPGSWRMYASFIPETGPGKGEDFVLSSAVTVPGVVANTALPAPSRTAETDGYTVTVDGESELTAGIATPLTITITQDGKPVTDLQPYLGAYAHLTAFHEGDAAFVHLHPLTEADGANGGPTLPFSAVLPQPGNWRLFLQFQVGGKLHTAALTLHVS